MMSLICLILMCFCMYKLCLFCMRNPGTCMELCQRVAKMFSN